MRRIKELGWLAALSFVTGNRIDAEGYLLSMWIMAADVGTGSRAKD